MQRSLFLTLALLLLLSAGAAQAQVDLEAAIPFEFLVGNKVLPAGNYTLTTDIVSGVVQIHGRRNGENAAIISFALGGGDNSQHESELVFNRYGDSYFLSQMWGKYSSTGRAIPQTRRERTVAKNEEVRRVTLVLARR